MYINGEKMKLRLQDELESAQNAMHSALSDKKRRRAQREVRQIRIELRQVAILEELAMLRHQLRAAAGTPE